MLKFGRTYTLKVQDESGGIVTITNPFTLDFTITRANLASLGTGVFMIANLAEATRNRLYKDSYALTVYPSVELYAGYGANQSLVFKGTVRECSSYRQQGGVNFVTKIEAYMGSVATVNGFSSQSISGPVSQLQVIDALISNLAPLEKGYVSPSFATVYPRGRSLCGFAWGLLQNETGFRAFVDNGRIYCMREGDILPQDVLLITSETGLLGVPKRSKTFVEAEMLFEPQMAVGRRVELRSYGNAYLNNIYTVTGVEHYGTISDAVNGPLVTKVSMFIGFNPLFPALQEGGAVTV